MKQKFENLPAEIRESRRFFETRGKVPIIQKWQDPANQKSFTEINGDCGFDISGRGTRADFLLIDFDHCLNDSGDFVNAEVADLVGEIQLNFKSVYIEKSVSGTGLHILMKPTEGKFAKITNGENGKFYFGNEYGKGAPCVELFYLNAARHVLLTGDLFDCDEGAELIIPAGEAVDNFLENLLADIQKQLEARGLLKPARNADFTNIFEDDEETITEIERAETPAELKKDLIAALLATIPPAPLEYSDWLACMTAAKTLGVSYAEIDSWNKQDAARYDEKANAAQWQELNNGNFDIRTLIGKAKAQGFCVKDFYKNWYDDHPQFSKRNSGGKRSNIEKQLWFLDGVTIKETGENLKAKFLQLYNSPRSFARNNGIRQILRDTLEHNVDFLGRPAGVKKSFNNFSRIFDLDPFLENLLAFNEFTNKITFGKIKHCDWRRGDVSFTDWEDADDAALRLYIRKNYCDLNDARLTEDFITTLSRRNAYHPIKTFFENLPRWDGKPRAETLFVDFLKVADTEFARAVTMKWLLAAICRVYYPACNFQAALVLQGNQNIGKSYILEQLGGAWYGCLNDSVDDMHALDSIREMWICELKEFSAARKAEINALKSFIERGADTYRSAYERRAKTFKRQVVFAISVNDKQFLRDTTGARRFWILQSPLEMFQYQKGLTLQYIQQIWAEVFAKFKELTAGGFNPKILELPLELKQHGEAVAENFTADDGLKSEIAAWLDIPILPPVLWKVLTIAERRKFYAEKSITLEHCDWGKRGEGLSEDDAAEYEAALENPKYATTFEKSYGKDNTTVFTQIYGSYTRQSTCAAEVFNEFFVGNDKRKNILRIAEALEQLDNWRLTGKQVKSFHGFGNQKKIFARVKNSEV